MARYDRKGPIIMKSKAGPARTEQAVSPHAGNGPQVDGEGSAE
jgi:hypothetical protein